MNPRGAPLGARLFGLVSTWRVALAVCVVVLTVTDIVVVGAGTGFLTSGFNIAHIGPVALLTLFVPMSLLLDLWLVLCIWLVAIPLLRATTASHAQRLLGALFAGIGLPIAVTVARYNIHALLGDMFSLALSHRFSGLGVSDIALGALQEFPYASLLAIAALTVALFALRIADRLEQRYADRIAITVAPSARRLLQAVAVLFVANSVALCAATAAMSDLNFGLDVKISGKLMTRLLDAITDIDRDGFGILQRPLDDEPIDASVHPYALDVPGNGRDEDQIAGDLPAGFSWPGLDGGEVAAPADGGERPHLLLVYLESFRYDLLEQRVGEREVTPFLNRLAREGSSSAHAYTHAPWTLASRDQLFTGRLVTIPGETTLIDDLASRGYRVAYFSGQDDAYGDSAARLGATRAEVFYDARQDIALRTTRSTAPVSLQVSWRTVVRRVTEYLEHKRDPRPLFLYVNVVDTHFPYWHEEIEDLLGVEPLRRSEIRARNAERVREGYANTAANVDRAVAQIVAAFREHVGSDRYAILVTSDHGQALYDDGLLGHGQSLNLQQTRVPFILWGIGGDWPDPIAPTDVRRLLVENLARREPPTSAPRARFVADPQRRVFQFLPDVALPSVIGLQGIDERLEYAFTRNEFVRVDAAGAHTRLDEATHPELRELVWRWEKLQALDHAVTGGLSPTRFTID